MIPIDETASKLRILTSVVSISPVPTRHMVDVTNASKDVYTRMWGAELYYSLFDNRVNWLQGVSLERYAFRFGGSWACAFNCIPERGNIQPP